MENIIIGKRITFGAIVGGVVSTFCWYWSLAHEPIPAEIAIGFATTITGIGQVILANKFGITTQ